jgi:2-C-methyl-D-erythritol 4-phosphate cytidylyltransferase
MFETACILLAGGSGQRFGGDQPKQFARIAGKTVLEHSLSALREHMPGCLIVVTAPYPSLSVVTDMFRDDPLVKVVAGGISRQASTREGLRALSPYGPKNVLIHDAARPFLDGRIVRDVLDALQANEAVDVAIPTADTIISERGGFIEHIPKRSQLLRGQTPQAFNFDNLIQCYENIDQHLLEKFTDDCGLYIFCHPQAKIKIVLGSEENIKITHPTDMILADELFRLRSKSLMTQGPGIDVRGKGVVIFGGSRGIGKAMADILISGGAKVEIHSRSTGCDISSLDNVEFSLQEACLKMGHIDVVVNAAGLLNSGNLTEQTPQQIQEQIATNFSGALNVARHSHKYLKASRGHLILFASSSYTRGRAGYVVYSSTKAAIVNLAQGLSEEWFNDGVRVSCVVPGRTDTEMRGSNFSNENQRSLFSPYEVALGASKIINSSETGSLFRFH